MALCWVFLSAPLAQERSSDTHQNRRVGAEAGSAALGVMAELQAEETHLKSRAVQTEGQA